ncbi:choice-of-anchor U domain-containing protein [Ottowia sp. VDI28]|uniref:choice-of-anchor U domain-containing protein n=1 Tax=Ottowia sp. VDI28 TaxID=3133968 RepID=UPI003C307FDB
MKNCSLTLAKPSFARLAPLTLALAAAGLSISAQAALVITEVMPSGSSSDWFELTNTGNTVVDLTGFRMDDSSFAFANSVPLTGIALIAPGESVLFTEDTTTTAFIGSYGVCLNNVRVGVYSGSGVGLGAGGDGVVVYSSGGVEQTRQAFGAATSKTSFYFTANNSQGTVSASGAGGAVACSNTDIASPGKSDGTVAPPGAPVAPGAMGISSTGFTATWTAPATGGTPTGYIVEVSADSFATVAKTAVVGNSTSVSVTGLNPGTSYAYRVRALNTGGPGFNATASSFSTLAGLSTTLDNNSAYSSVMGDVNEHGFTFALNNAAGAVTLTAVSSNQAVVPDANLQITGAGPYTLSLTPLAVGKADLTVTASDGVTQLTRTIHYAASANTGGTAGTRWYTGRSDGSSAVVLDSASMLVADDEAPGLGSEGNAAQSGSGNAFSAYSRSASGLPLKPLALDGAALGLGTGKNGVECTTPNLYTGIADCDADAEVDSEASFQTAAGGPIFLIGSHSNSKKGKSRPDRWRFIQLSATGGGSSTSLSMTGYYKWLREDLRAWDAGNTHGLGADYFGISDSSAGASGGDESSPKAPETATLSGFSIEGMTTSPDNSAAWLGFRAPLVSAPGGPAVTADSVTGRTHALIVQVTNYGALPNVSGGAKSTATFGTPIRLDLGGRGIREIRKGDDGQYLIIAGTAGGTSLPFALYSWDGSVNTAGLAVNLRLLDANLSAFTKPATECAAEGIVSQPANLAAGGEADLISDCGDQDFYGDGTVAKDLPYAAWKKFRADVVTLPALPTVAISSGAATTTTLPFTATPSAAGTLYAVVLPQGAPAPSWEQVVAGTDSTGAAAVYSSGAVTAAAVPQSLTATGLTPSASYDVYAVVVTAGNYAGALNKGAGFSTSTPVTIGTTLDTGAPTGTSGSVAANGWVFADNSAGFASPAVTPPNVDGYTFPYGQFSFVLVNGEAGSSATVSLNLPRPAPAGSVLWKYGRQAPGGAQAWYQITPSFSGDRKTVSFTVADGPGDTTGDDDQTVNRVIVDPVLLAVPSAGGGGTVAAVPTLSEVGRWLLALALTGLAALRMRSRQRG